MKYIRNFEKYIFSLLFLVGLFWLSFASLKNTIPTFKEDFNEIKIQSKELIEAENTTLKAKLNSTGELVKSSVVTIQGTISQNVYERYKWIETYGLINKVLNKKEYNGFDYAIDKHGSLNSVNFWVDVDDIDVQRYSQQIRMLSDSVEKKGGNFIFAACPNKYDEAWNSGYDGIPYNDFNNKMDELLLWNRRYGIDSIDFRETLKKENLSFNEMFYKTDHHWTGYGAFVAYKSLVKHINTEYNAGLDPDGFYTDINNYEVDYVENMYLGSQGRDAGLKYSGGLEDFQTVKPKFSGDFTFDGRTGDYTETVYYENFLEYDDVYNSDVYSYYLSGVNDYDKVINNENPDGLKIFYIRDSFFAPIIIYMLPFCSEVDCVWGKYATDDYVKKMIDENDYDYVILSYYTENISSDFFQFYKDDYPEIETVEE